jgi:malate synthase
MSHNEAEPSWITNAINMHSMYFTCETFDILSNSHIKHHEGNIYIYIPGTEHHEGINLMPDIFRY